MEKSAVSITQWSDTHGEPLTEVAVRRLHMPSERYRIRTCEYPPGTKFPAAAKQRTCYVVQGSWSYARGAESWTLSAGQVAELPTGDYRLEVIGAQPLRFIHVFDLFKIAPPCGSPEG